MSSKNEDDFWNTSSSSAFNFDDEDDNNDTEFDNIFMSSSAQNKPSVLPIGAIISKASLDFVLDDIKTTTEYSVQPVEEAIKKMQNGHKHHLEVYKRLDEKLFLLDSAVETGDGNIILEVVLFLKNSLKMNLFYLNMAKRPAASKHFIRYLMSCNKLEELADFYMASGNTACLKTLVFMIFQKNSNKKTLKAKLETFCKEHLGNEEDRAEIMDFLLHLDYQIKQQPTDSVMEHLALLCKETWAKKQNSLSEIMEFKKEFKIDDYSFEWTIMNVMASLQMWPQLTQFFLKTNFLGKRVSLKSVIPIEVFIYAMSQHKPPHDVLEQFVNCNTDLESNLYLAQKLKNHKLIIQCLINQRDRQVLMEYKNKVPQQSDEYFLIENALLSPDRKWKN